MRRMPVPRRMQRLRFELDAGVWYMGGYESRSAVECESETQERIMIATRVVRPSSTIAASDGPNSFRPRCQTPMHCVCGETLCDPFCETDPRRPPAVFLITSGSCPVCRCRWAERVCEDCFLVDERHLYEPPFVITCPRCSYSPLAFPTITRI
jgi:hypothetical protein